jgi:Leu/Phe-tRNA-protein transferase
LPRKNFYEALYSCGGEVMEWLELWAKIQVIGGAIGVLIGVIAVGYVFIREWRNLNG